MPQKPKKKINSTQIGAEHFCGGGKNWETIYGVNNQNEPNWELLYQVGGFLFLVESEPTRQLDCPNVSHFDYVTTAREAVASLISKKGKWHQNHRIISNARTKYSIYIFVYLRRNSNQ